MAKTAPHCHIHPDVALICPSCRSAKGGAATKGVTSKVKARASVRNGRLGGRPKLPTHAPGCHQQATGRYTKGCPRCQYEDGKRQTENRAFELRNGFRDPA
jgi:hypothetical protein